MYNLLRKLAVNCIGASAAEYALIMAIIGSAVAIAAVVLGLSIGEAMNDTTNNISQ